MSKVEIALYSSFCVSLTAIQCHQSSNYHPMLPVGFTVSAPMLIQLSPLPLLFIFTGCLPEWPGRCTNPVCLSRWGQAGYAKHRGCSQQPLHQGALVSWWWEWWPGSGPVSLTAAASDTASHGKKFFLKLLIMENCFVSNKYVASVCLGQIFNSGWISCKRCTCERRSQFHVILDTSFIAL